VVVCYCSGVGRRIGDDTIRRGLTAVLVKTVEEQSTMMRDGKRKCMWSRIENPDPRRERDLRTCRSSASALQADSYAYRTYNRHSVHKTPSHHECNHATPITPTNATSTNMPALTLPPILTRSLLLLNLLLSALNASLRFHAWRTSAPNPSLTSPSNYLSDPRWAVPYLALVPVKSIKYPWTFATASVVENNIISLAVSASVIWFGGRYLERAWGGNEFAKFVLFVTVIPNILTFVLYAIWHVVAGTPELYVGCPHATCLHTDGFDSPTPLQGLLALEAAFLVALKQLVPEHTVSLFRGSIRVRIKHFPALFTLANIFSGPLLGTDTALWLSLFGFLTGWIYLRFFRLSDIGVASDVEGEGEGVKLVKGDASDTFAFVAFFPDVMHPFISPVTDGIYETLVALRVCTPFSNAAIQSGNEDAAARAEGLPGILESGHGGGGRRAEAERRRALALKALDQRLNAAAANRGATTNVAEPVTSGNRSEPVNAAGEAGAGVEESQG
jgi:membrane associated rhomboid family serine protease